MRLASAAPPLLIDVRSAARACQQRIDGSVAHSAQRSCRERLPELPHDRRSRRALRRRLPLVDRREPAAARGTGECQRDRRRHRGLGSGPAFLWFPAKAGSRTRRKSTPGGWTCARLGVAQSGTCCPSARVVLEAQPAAVGLDRPFRDRQTESRCRRRCRLRTCRAIEAIEDAGARLGRDARTGVADVDDRARRRVSATRMRIRPPAGVYLIALSTRLISACRSTSRSPTRVGVPARSTTSDCRFLLGQHAEVRRRRPRPARADRPPRPTASPARSRRATASAADRPGSASRSTSSSMLPMIAR